MNSNNNSSSSSSSNNITGKMEPVRTQDSSSSPSTTTTGRRVREASSPSSSSPPTKRRQVNDNVHGHHTFASYGAPPSSPHHHHQYQQQYPTPAVPYASYAPPRSPHQQQYQYQHQQGQNAAYHHQLLPHSPPFMAGPRQSWQSQSPAVTTDENAIAAALNKQKLERIESELARKKSYLAKKEAQLEAFKAGDLKEIKAEYDSFIASEVTPIHNEIAAHKLRIEELQHSIGLCDYRLAQSNAEHVRLYTKWEKAEKSKDHFYVDIVEIHQEIAELKREKNKLQPAVSDTVNWKQDSLPECRLAVLEALQAMCAVIVREGRSKKVKSVITKLDKSELKKLTEEMVKNMWNIMSTGGFAFNRGCLEQFKHKKNKKLLLGAYDIPSFLLIDCILGLLRLDEHGNPIANDDVEE